MMLIVGGMKDLTHLLKRHRSSGIDYFGANGTTTFEHQSE
jgi:hypothetical protein